MRNRYYRIIILLIGLFSFQISNAQNLEIFFKKTAYFLNENVSEGKVNYKKIKKSPSNLNELLKIASEIKVEKSKSNQYRAFWINAYNLTVIKSVVAQYPLKSPLDITGFFDKKTHSIAGVKITLNDIENKLLRGQFNNDPRFHFVLVCAGLGCPPIIKEAYLPNTIEDQLDRQTTLTLNNSEFIKVNEKKNKVQFSQIFEWYTTDFTTNDKSLIQFVNIYRKKPLPNSYKSSYYSYDWSLNELK
jgi:hypothetical protein